MRGLIKDFLCRAGYEPCIKEARDQFKKWLTDEEPDKGNPLVHRTIYSKNLLRVPKDFSPPNNLFLTTKIRESNLLSINEQRITLARKIIFHRVANKFLCPVFKWGTNAEWEFGLQRVINFPKTSLARKQNERTYLLKTLAGCPKDANKIERSV